MVENDRVVSSDLILAMRPVIEGVEEDVGADAVLKLYVGIANARIKDVHIHARSFSRVRVEAIKRPSRGSSRWSTRSMPQGGVFLRANGGSVSRVYNLTGYNVDPVTPKLLL